MLIGQQIIKVRKKRYMDIDNSLIIKYCSKISESIHRIHKFYIIYSPIYFDARLIISQYNQLLQDKIRFQTRKYLEKWKNSCLRQLRVLS